LPGANAEVALKRWRTIYRLAFGGGVGMGEAYMDGDWESPDIAVIIALVAGNRSLADDGIRPNPIVNFLHWLRHGIHANTRAGSRRNIAAHYDLGNEFYWRWLDATMTYSSALFATKTQPLEEAQRNKCRRLLDLLGSTPGQHVLEIGSGWGGFAVLAAKERGLKVTGITLSKEQHVYAQKRAFEEGLADRVKFEIRDYRDLVAKFDHVASIEMFEAVGEAYWPIFFHKVFESVYSGGRAALQIITIDDRYFETYRSTADFIQTYIFPGGMLPSPSRLKDESAKAGLAWLGDSGFGDDYAKTLLAWRIRFESAWADIKTLGFDDRFHRMWRFYLAYCEGGFRAGSIDVKQIALARP
ncbi:MAG: class I SAM-dependent methyltransferase, partial [Alphaproteobacteria bacterium]|nr:class I SAM-dependent methyltransferase [Alphaproteobacteria bacterium]